MTAHIDVKSIECRYRQHIIVSDMSLHVNQGEIACLLGKSGCGKTTLLRAIAGLEPIYKGEIHCNGKIISTPNYRLPPESRNFGMVFQDYALFPHLTIEDNISFGLRDKSPSERRDCVKRMLQLVEMSDYVNRYPHELSGGQQQRIALARTLAVRPTVILLDEPFSSLDVDTREELSYKVKDILKNEGITGILVTHHQDEAFNMGDHIGILHNGHILQWDTPFNIYHEPGNYFVADFIGQGVFIPAKVLTPDKFDTAFGIFSGDRAYQWKKGTLVDLLLRPDDVICDPQSQLKGEVIQKAFKGAEIMYTLKLDSGLKILSLFPSHEDHAIGAEVGIRLDLQHLVAFEQSNASAET